MKMNKVCRFCLTELTLNNAASSGIRNGKRRYRNECKECKNLEWAKRYNKGTRTYIRKFRCINCKKLCFKKCKKVFCSVICRMKFNIDYKNPDECWLWKSTKNEKGYGTFKIGKIHYMATRYVYEYYNKTIDENKILCHTCDNTSCVNPAHLWEGTYKENTDDMRNKGRHNFYGWRIKT